VTGTFSSIYVAGPILLFIERKWPRSRGEKGQSPRSASSAPPRPTKPRSPVAAR
jgi:hypothetical protein